MNEDVVFWTWISPSHIGLVTTNSVYHWNLEGGDSAPFKIFDKDPTMMPCQIINYRVNPEGNWMILIGISAQVLRISIFK